MAAALTCAAALIASGCVSFDMRPPTDLPVPTEYGRGDSNRNAPVGTLTPVELSTPKDGVVQAWWKQLGDERLDRLVSQVLDVNTDLASAGLRLEQARLAAGVAFDALLPQTDASVGTNYSKPLQVEGPGLRSSGVTLGVGYEVDLWRKLRGAHDIARWEAQATAEDLQSTALALIGETCNLYWTLAFLNQSIATREASSARLQRTQQLVQAQFAAGAVSRLELREAEQNVQAERIARSQLEQQRVEARNALTVLLDGQPWPIDAEPHDLRSIRAPDIQEGLPAELLARRPDMRAAELRLRAAMSNVDVTRVGYYPALNLTSSLGTSSQTLGDLIANPVATLGAGLALPFLRWNQMQMNVKIASKDYAIVVNDFRRTLYRAFTEVDNALSEREELARQLDASQRSLDEAIEIERLYGVRYRAGAAPLRNWLDAQETRRTAELTLAQVRLSHLQNYSTLFRAVGG